LLRSVAPSIRADHVPRGGHEGYRDIITRVVGRVIRSE
jgi:hypothetical protein